MLQFFPSALSPLFVYRNDVGIINGFSYLGPEGWLTGQLLLPENGPANKLSRESDDKLCQA